MTKTASAIANDTLVTIICAAVDKAMGLNGWRAYQVTDTINAVEQNFPEAMLADRVHQLDVTGLTPDQTARLIEILVAEDLAVERVMPEVNVVASLRIWPMEGSICRQQRDAVLSAVRGFRFVDGWQWRDDECDKMFQNPYREADGRTWVAGVYYGLAEGGVYGMWNDGMLVVTFGDRLSAQVEEVALYTRNGDTIYKMTPGKSFARSERPPQADTFANWNLHRK